MQTSCLAAVKQKENDRMAAGMRGVIEATDLRQEAQAVAAAVVACLQDKRVVVVCGDDELREMLRSALRWRGVMATSSEGLPLLETAAGRLLQRVLDVLQQAADDELAPGLAMTLAALGAHPLVSPNMDWTALEALIWRGGRFETWAGLREKAVRAEDAAAKQGLDVDLVGPVEKLSGIFRLALVGTGGILKLLDGLAPAWRQALGGAALAEWLGPITVVRGADGLMALQKELARQRVEYPAGMGAPVPLLRPQEALNVTTDVVIVTGLNVSWDRPGRGDIEPLLLANYGIEEEAPNVFAQLQMNAREMVVSRALQRNGETTVAARAWQELMQREDAAALMEAGQKWLPATPMPMGHARRLGRWPALGTAGPQAWSASWLKTVLDCPYQAVGRRLLALEKFAPFGTLPDKATGGILVHEWVEQFWRQANRQTLTRDAARALFMDIAEGALVQESALVQRLWRPRLARLAQALIRAWQADGAAGRQTQGLEAQLEGIVGGEAFKARADRVDEARDGSRIIVDYKTGHTPTPGEVKSGRQPQLPLEAALLAGHGERVSGLEYWQLRGYGREPVKRTAFGEAQTAELTAAAMEHLPRVRVVLGREQPFPATPEPEGACKRCPLSGVCRWREATA